MKAKKIHAKLEARRKAFDMMSEKAKRTGRRPGSLNNHKKG